jgi:hypothetical protein
VSRPPSEASAPSRPGVSLWDWTDIVLAGLLGLGLANALARDVAQTAAALLAQLDGGLRRAISNLVTQTAVDAGVLIVVVGLVRLRRRASLRSLGLAPGD